MNVSHDFEAFSSCGAARGGIAAGADFVLEAGTAGAPSVLDLPTDKPRSAVQSQRRATERFVLSEELRGRLKSLVQKQQATLSMVLEAAFMTLLHRYRGEDDILVGAFVCGRTHLGTQGPIGSFSNTVVLRCRFADSLNFCQLLQQVRERMEGAHAHAELPFKPLVAEVAPGWD
jgi:Condensation domain